MVQLGEAARLWSYYVSHSQLLVRWPGTPNVDLSMQGVGELQLPVFLGNTTAYASPQTGRGHLIEFVDQQGQTVGHVACAHYRISENENGIDDDGLLRLPRP